MSLKIGLEQMKQIPDLVKDGLTNREIAFYFNCHPHTVKLALKRLRDAGYQLSPRKKGRPFDKKPPEGGSH
jgi:transposase